MTDEQERAAIENCFQRMKDKDAAASVMLAALKDIASHSKGWAKPGADPMLESIEYAATQAIAAAESAGIK